MTADNPTYVKRPYHLAPFYVDSNNETEVPVCDLCGTVVWESELHDAFHARLERLDGFFAEVEDEDEP